jgi:hypothetical protein
MTVRKEFNRAVKIRESQNGGKKATQSCRENPKKQR